MLGLTGGIGAGKSTVARMLAERGAIVIDTDVIARDVTAPGGAAHQAMRDRFGPLDRAALAELAFTDPVARRDLNAIVHPAVEAVVQGRLAGIVASGPVVVDVPLLVEAGWEPMFTSVVVVDCPEEVAVRRLVSGRGMDEGDVRRRMAAQATRSERLARADVVLSNDGTLDHLREQVDRLWAELVTLNHRNGG